ncbi:MAG TPA: hypothetical protein VMZ30_21645 [Pyrinomonadaceae bacterium]|nr:hypothetical protein [Pyrinomonadaceae bacterium]
MLINRLSIRFQSSRYKSIGEIIKYKRQEQQENHCLAEDANDVFSVAFSANGKWIASGGEDKRSFVYRLR